MAVKKSFQWCFFFKKNHITWFLSDILGIYMHESSILKLLYHFNNCKNHTVLKHFTQLKVFTKAYHPSLILMK